MAEKTSRVVSGRGARAKGSKKPKIKTNPKNWEEFLEHCSKEQKDAAEKVRRINDTKSENELLTDWRLGKMIEEIQSDEAVYGKGFITKLSKQLNDNPSHMYKQIAFYTCFPETDDINRVVAMRLNGTARRLSFTSHIIPIVEKRLTREQRWEGLERTVKEGWSGKQLKNWINATIGKPASNRSASGRKRTVPELPANLLPYLSETFGNMVRALQTMDKPDKGVIANLNRTGPDMILPSWCAHLKSAIGSMTTTMGLLEKLRPGLQAILERYERAANPAIRNNIPEKPADVGTPTQTEVPDAVEDPDLAKLFSGI